MKRRVGEEEKRRGGEAEEAGKVWMGRKRWKEEAGGMG